MGKGGKSRNLALKGIEEEDDDSKDKDEDEDLTKKGKSEKPLSNAMSAKVLVI